MPPELPDQEGDPQDNFVEASDPSELALCIILACAYLGLAKYCWDSLIQVANWKLLINVEGFFGIISAVAIMIGARPFLTPSSLQLSARGIKYRGPYWPQRKTVNWDQVVKIYVSSELLIVLYKPKPDSKRIWPMLIFAIYLADRERIPSCVLKYSPLKPVMMTSPTLVSRIVMGLMLFVVIVWILEMLMGG
ncbi:MAG TPA: hypothetical protein V6C72_07575 [Chroococcales cyanobacterium]